MSVAQTQTTNQLHPAMLPALTAAVQRAKAAFPAETTKIERGLSLVLQDAVSDTTLLAPHTYTVRSQGQPWRQYTVVSNGTTTCTCPDFERHQALCKHGFAVLLVRSARRAALQPRLRHAYHLVSGEEGHCRVLAGGRVVFFPGGHTYAFVCTQDEVCIGPHVHTEA